MRRYSISEAADRTGLHLREINHYLKHFSRFFNNLGDAVDLCRLNDSDLTTLERIHDMLARSMSPAEVETYLLSQSNSRRVTDFNRPRIMLVSSAFARAGKSVIAYGIASALASLASGVKLIDFGTAGPRSSELSKRGEVDAVDATAGLQDLESSLNSIDESRWLVIDTGSAEQEVTLRLAPLADLIFVIVTEDVAANAEAMSLVRAVYEVDSTSPTVVLINHVRSFQQAKDVFTRVNAVSTRLLNMEMQSVGWFCEDDRLRTAVASDQLTRELTPGLPFWNSADSVAAEAMARAAKTPERHTASSARQIITSLSRSAYRQSSDANRSYPGDAS